MAPNQNTFLLRFTPERWSWLDKYANFAGISGAVPPGAFRGVQIVTGHLGKFDTLAALADKIAERLWVDTQEIEEHGHSRSINSKEYAALLETLVCELYSSVDGVRAVLFHLFRKTQGIQNASNERLLKRAAEGKYEHSLPPPISDALSTAYGSWFPSLRELRKELTHGEVGSCHRDRKTGGVSYFHRGLGSDAGSFVSETIVADIRGWRRGIADMHGPIFRHLYASLPQRPMFQVCGFYQARLYEREVVPTMTITSTDGYCRSRHWFDKTPDLKCPLRHRCLAYERKRDTDA